VRGTQAGLIVFAGVATLNLANAMFHLVTARTLGPREYGTVASLLALSGLIALPLGGIQLAVARYVAEDAARGRLGAVGEFTRRALTASVVAGVVLTVVVVAVSSVIRDALGIGSLLPVILMGLYTFPAVVAPVAWGLAQGLQRFTTLSVSVASGSVVRTAVVLALIPFGLGVGGAMMATLVSAFAAVAIVVPTVVSSLRAPSLGQRGPANGEALRYLVPVLVGTLAITSLTTVDLIAAKLALTPRDAGIYGAGSFVGRLLLYLPMTVATVLLPKVTSRAAVEEDTTEILYASIAVTAALSLLGTLVLIAAPRTVIDLTFGSSYGDAAPLVGLFGLAMTLYAILNVQLVYHLGHGRRGMALLLLGGAALQIGLYGAVHGSTYRLVSANLASAALLLVAHEVVLARTLPGAAGWAFRTVTRRGREQIRRLRAPDGFIALLRPGRRDLVALGACLGLLAIWFFPLLTHLDNGVLSTRNDEAYGIRVFWAAGHAGESPFTLHRDLFNGWPEGQPLSTAIEWANALNSGPLWLLHYVVGLTTASNLFLLGGFLLTGLASWLFFNRLGFSVVPTAFAAFAITFNPWLVYRAYAGQHGFMQVWVFIVEIVALLYVHKHRSLTGAVLAGVSLALALYTNSYFGLMGAVIYGVFWLVDLARRQGWRERLWSFTLFDASMAALLIAVIPVLFVWATQRATVGVSVGHSDTALQNGGAWPAAYLLPATRNPLLGGITNAIRPNAERDWSESPAFPNTLYLGWTLIVLGLAGLGLVLRRHRETLVSPTRRYLLVSTSVLAPVAFLFSLKRVTLGIPMPSWFMGHITTYWRIYARFGLIVTIALAILAAVALQALWRRSRTGRLLATAALVLLVVEFLPGVPNVYRLDAVPPWAQWLKRQPPGAVANYPLPTDKAPARDLVGNAYFLQTTTAHPNFAYFGSGSSDTREDAIRILVRYVDSPFTPSVLKAEDIRYVLLHDDVYRDQGEQPPTVPPGFHLVRTLPGPVRVLELDPTVKPADLSAVLEQNAAAIAQVQGLPTPTLTVAGGTPFEGSARVRLAWAAAAPLRRVTVVLHAQSADGPRTLELSGPDGTVYGTWQIGTGDTQVSFGPLPLPPGTSADFTLKSDPAGRITILSTQVQPLADFSTSLRNY